MKKMNRKYKNIAMGIAASMVILLGGGSAYAYNTPVAHVSLDVNPSITFTVNSFDRVIGVENVNEDGEAILETIDWDGEKLTAVVEQTIIALKAGNYLGEGDWYINSLLVGVEADSDSTKEKLIATIKQELGEIVYEETNDAIDEEKLNEVVVGIGAERVADAIKLTEELGFPITPGKLNLVQKLDASYLAKGEEHMTDSEAAVWLEGPVKDIMAQVKANRLEAKETTPEGIDSDLDVDLDDVDSDNKGNGNVNANENANKNNDNNEIEKQKNGNNGHNNVTPEAIETEND